MYELTSNHCEIQNWAAQHDAFPAQIRPQSYAKVAAELRFVFGEDREYGTSDSEPISWNTFFVYFEKHSLIMAYDETLDAVFMQDHLYPRMI